MLRNVFFSVPMKEFCCICTSFCLNTHSSMFVQARNLSPLATTVDQCMSTPLFEVDFYNLFSAIVRIMNPTTIESALIPNRLWHINSMLFRCNQISNNPFVVIFFSKCIPIQNWSNSISVCVCVRQVNIRNVPNISGKSNNHKSRIWKIHPVFIVSNWMCIFFHSLFRKQN